jgi:hypothetical protein
MGCCASSRAEPAPTTTAAPAAQPEAKKEIPAHYDEAHLTLKRDQLSGMPIWRNLKAFSGIWGFFCGVWCVISRILRHYFVD